jgi:hypothetical protein
MICAGPLFAARCELELLNWIQVKERIDLRCSEEHAINKEDKTTLS